MVLHGAASRAAFLDSSAVLKKRSSMRTYHCHPAPHHCGGQEVCQANGLTRGFCETAPTHVRFALQDDRGLPSGRGPVWALIDEFVQAYGGSPGNDTPAVYKGFPIQGHGEESGGLCR